MEQNQTLFFFNIPSEVDDEEKEKDNFHRNSLYFKQRRVDRLVNKYPESLPLFFLFIFFSSCTRGYFLPFQKLLKVLFALKQ